MTDHTKKPKVRPLSIYLLKSSIKSARTAVEDPSALRESSVPMGRAKGRLFVKQSRIVPPAWASFFAGVVDLRSVSLKSASASALLVLRVAGRFFAVTFGYGRHLLKPGSWDASFGLRVALNSIEPNSIRSIDRKIFDAIARHTREEASRAGSIDQFGLNIDRDLLRAVVGKPSDENLGRLFAGMDALTATVGIELRDLPKQIERYFQQWGKTGYKRRYPWVDQIAEIRDRRQQRKLDEAVVAQIASGNLGRTWLAVPDPIDWSRVGGFRYSKAERAETHEDIHLRAFLDTLRDPEHLSPETLRRRPVYCLDPNGQHPMEKWTVYQCLYAELRYEGDVALLTGGSWYRIARGFVARVDREVAKIAESPFDFPAYDHESETSYNRSVAQGNANVALMDAKNIRYGGGASQIEFCDLFTSEKQMLHVKRYGGSSVVSHLFAQGIVSATLYLQDVEFRREVNRMLPKSHRLADPARRPNSQSYEVGFAIVSRSKRDLSLPFFSKVNLRYAAQTLRGMGYQVTLTKIETAGRA